MRKFLITSLLATAALSAQAFAADDQQRRQRGGTSEASNDDGQSRPSRPSARSESSDDSPRPARRERPQPSAGVDDGAASQQSQQQPTGRRRSAAVPQLPSSDGASQQSTQAAPALSPFQQRLRDRRAAQASSSTTAQAPTAQIPTGRSTARAPGIAGGPRRGFLSGQVATAPSGGKIRVASKPDKAWYAKWREQRLYNWEQHRARNRDHYHLGNYWDPYGYNYRRWQVGWMMWPSYYQNSYWLDDPYSWRLPPVYGPYRWVRYWDDALLVNIYSGQVVDVLYNVFW